MVPPETHTRPKQIRIPDDLWERLERAVGTRRRSAVVVKLIRWYLSEPGAKRPVRPNQPETTPTAGTADPQTPS